MGRSSIRVYLYFTPIYEKWQGHSVSSQKILDTGVNNWYNMKIK